MVDIRRYQSNDSIEVVYYALLDGSCYSASEISALLNNLTLVQFSTLTSETPIIVAEGDYIIMHQINESLLAC